MEEYVVKSTSGEYTRRIWLLKGSQEKPQKLCIFLDAEYYLKRLDAPAVLLDLQTRKVIPPITCLFVSHLDGAARHSDYTCNPRYSRFIAEDLLHWIKNKDYGISVSENVICGLSLSGLASAYLALTYPELFTSSLCQSPSFWWNDEWLNEQVEACSSLRSKFWISVGDKENEAIIAHPPSGMFQGVSQIAAAEKAAKTFVTRGATVNYHCFTGGHEIAPWQEELPFALHWLLGQDLPE